MISGNLSQISRLLDARFADFMDVDSLRVTGHDYGEHNFMVEDASYGITAAHHFPVSQNTSEQLTSYPAFKTTLDRRIARLLDQFALASRLLLVRLGVVGSKRWNYMMCYYRGLHMIFACYTWIIQGLMV